MVCIEYVDIIFKIEKDLYFETVNIFIKMFSPYFVHKDIEKMGVIGGSRRH